MPTQQAFQSNPWGLPCVWSCYLQLKFLNCKSARKNLKYNEYMEKNTNLQTEPHILRSIFFQNRKQSVLKKSNKFILFMEMYNFTSVIDTVLFWFSFLYR